MFPARLREIRHGKHITLEHLANDLNKQYPSKNPNTANQIGNWERGIRTPSYLEVRKLAEYFDVSMDYLCGKTATNVHDLNMIFLSEQPIRFNEKILTNEDRYELYQLINGYFYGKEQRRNGHNRQQEELRLDWDKQDY